LNPGHRGGKPATNRLSYGAAKSTLSNLLGDPYINLVQPRILFYFRHFYDAFLNIEEDLFYSPSILSFLPLPSAAHFLS
jgi:hypothetical protein